MQYYFSHDGANQQGPVEKEGLKAAGVSARTMVWREGMAGWTPAGQVPDLADLFASESPPVQLPPSGLMEPNYATPMPARTETNGMAIAALICGIIGVGGFCCCFPVVASILAVIFGHQSRGQIRAGRGTGDGLALAGIILGYIGIVLTILRLGVLGFTLHSGGGFPFTNHMYQFHVHP